MQFLEGCCNLKDADGHQYSNISLEQLSQSERAVLVEKHLMSPALEEKLPYRNLVVSDDCIYCNYGE